MSSRASTLNRPPALNQQALSDRRMRVGCMYAGALEYRFRCRDYQNQSAHRNE
jgi:hypothetical protein